MPQITLSTRSVCPVKKDVYPKNKGSEYANTYSWQDIFSFWIEHHHHHIMFKSHRDHRHFVPQTRGVWIEYAHILLTRCFLIFNWTSHHHHYITSWSSLKHTIIIIIFFTWNKKVSIYNTDGIFSISCLLNGRVLYNSFYIVERDTVDICYPSLLTVFIEAQSFKS